MKKLIVLILLVALVAWLWMNNKNTNTLAPEVQNVTVTYSDGTTVVPAEFNNTDGTVTFTHPELGTITLTNATSASGARFANEDETITFWEHQGEVAITSGDKEVFRGPIVSDKPTAETIDGAILGTWVWSNTKMNDDTTIVPKNVDDFTITFTDDGKVSGTTDCNGFMGTFTQPAQGEMSFGPLASTKMACKDSQENEFTSKLQDVSHYLLTEDGDLVLNIKFDSGSITFRKQ